jgi:hypothetical protein
MFLAAFLEQVLHCADDYLYSCPPILSFLDDSLGAGGGFKDVQIAILEEKVNIDHMFLSYRVICLALDYRDPMTSPTTSQNLYY